MVKFQQSEFVNWQIHPNLMVHLDNMYQSWFQISMLKEQSQSVGCVRSEVSNVQITCRSIISQPFRYKQSYADGVFTSVSAGQQRAHVPHPHTITPSQREDMNVPKCIKNVYFHFQPRKHKRFNLKCSYWSKISYIHYKHYTYSPSICSLVSPL